MTDLRGDIYRIDFKYSASIFDGQISIREEFDKNVCYYRIDARDKMIREGLIKLGWTPPDAKDAEIARLRAAITRQVNNITRWRETGKAASPEESREIYHQLCEAIGATPHD